MCGLENNMVDRTWQSEGQILYNSSYVSGQGGWSHRGRVQNGDHWEGDKESVFWRSTEDG